MSKISINDFYNCSHVSLASELFYICELGKYLKYMHNHTLSLSGVTFDSVLKESKIWFYFSIAIDEKWLVDVNVAKKELDDLKGLTPKDWKNKGLFLKNVMYNIKPVLYDFEDDNRRRTDFEYALRVPKAYQVAFARREDEKLRLTFDMSGKTKEDSTMNNISMNSSLSHLSWVSLIAYAAVLRQIDLANEWNSLTLILRFTDACIVNERSLAYVLNLVDKTKCFTWVATTFDSSIPMDKRLHLGYVAWYVEGEDKGLLAAKKDWFSPQEKYDYLSNLNLQVNDVVFLFERNELQRFNYIKTIANCKVAIIKSITKAGCVLQVCNLNELQSESKYKFARYSQEVQDSYVSGKPYEKFNAHIKEYTWINLGVEYLTTNEKYLLVPLEECEDSKTAHVTNGLTEYNIVLRQNEYIYWLLMEYKAEFNVDRFKEKYFTGFVPLYDLYVVNKEEMPSRFIVH